MKNRIFGVLLALLFATAALGQATPVSSGPNQPETPAATSPHKNTAHVRKARVQHAKSRHKGHKKHRKAA